MDDNIGVRTIACGELGVPQVGRVGNNVTEQQPAFGKQ